MNPEDKALSVIPRNRLSQKGFSLEALIDELAAHLEQARRYQAKMIEAHALGNSWEYYAALRDGELQAALLCKAEENTALLSGVICLLSDDDDDDDETETPVAVGGVQ